jgi:glycosyltransferase involved in cell wall biosynthesis
LAERLTDHKEQVSTARGQTEISPISNLHNTPGPARQPDLYGFASYLGHRLGCTHVVNIGCGDGAELELLSAQFEIISVDVAPQLEACGKQYDFGAWVEWDFTQPGAIPIPEDVLRRAVIVCTGVIERLAEPDGLLENIRRWMDHSPVCLLATPDRDLAAEVAVRDSLEGQAPARRWSLGELKELLRASELNVAFTGLTAGGDTKEKNVALAVITNNAWVNPDSGRESDAIAPPGFRVVAIMTTYNEEDIIAASIKRLVSQGIDVYLIDNWSADNTYALAEQFLGKGLIGIERFPADGPSPLYTWRGLLARVEELASEIEADWFIHHDADEVRESPWTGVSLRDAIYAVDRAGFNCINHTLILFHPVDDGFDAGEEFEAHFKYFEFGKYASDFLQSKTWKRLPEPVSLSASGGHQASFEGRRDYPYKFLLKHYPIRSQAHGEKKVFAERKPRYDPQEIASGWHAHYNKLESNHVFTRRAAELELFDDARFKREYLVERLSGVGVLSPAAAQAVAEANYPAGASCPLPVIRSQETIISTQLLTESEGTEYWVRTYEGGDIIFKQTTANLARREADFLTRLASDYFPRVLAARATEDYSMVALEKPPGVQLARAISDIRSDTSRLRKFIEHCMNLLGELKAASITHRNIWAENIFVRDDKPVLTDFTWAVSKADPLFTPEGLGGEGRPPDGGFSDAYSMGKVFEKVGLKDSAQFQPVIELMTNPDPSLRISDPEILRILFACAAQQMPGDERAV